MILNWLEGDWDRMAAMWTLELAGARGCADSHALFVLGFGCGIGDHKGSFSISSGETHC